MLWPLQTGRALAPFNAYSTGQELREETDIGFFRSPKHKPSEKGIIMQFAKTFALVGVLLAATFTMAQTVEIGQLSYQGGAGLQFSAELFGTRVAPGEYLVNGASGAYRQGSGFPIYSSISVVPVGTDSAYSYDNLLFTTGGTLVDSVGGILFNIAGIGDVNFWYSDGNESGWSDNGTWVTGSVGYVNSTGPNGSGTYTSTPVNASFTAAPEPSALALFGSGALGVFGVVRKRVLHNS